MVTLGILFACFLAGMVNAVAGGGILVVFPALLAAGFSPITANATSNLISWPGALSAAYAYRAHIRKLPSKYLLLLIPCLVGAIIGAALLLRTDSSEFTRIVPWLVLTAVVLFALQPFLHRHFERNLRTHRNAPLVIIGIALLPMAIYGGYFGAGFGFVMLAFLGFTRLTSFYQINGLKNLASATITLVCTVYFGFAGLIDWDYGLTMIAGSLLGGYVGARMAQRINPAIVHAFVIIVGLTVSAFLFWQAKA